MNRSHLPLFTVILKWVSNYKQRKNTSFYQTRKTIRLISFVCAHKKWLLKCRWFASLDFQFSTIFATVTRRNLYIHSQRSSAATRIIFSNRIAGFPSVIFVLSKVKKHIFHPNDNRSFSDTLPPKTSKRARTRPAFTDPGYIPCLLIYGNHFSFIFAIITHSSQRWGILVLWRRPDLARQLQLHKHQLCRLRLDLFAIASPTWCKVAPWWWS